MNTVKIEQLSEKEMKQILGGRWVEVAGQWYWLSYYSLDGDDEAQ